MMYICGVCGRNDTSIAYGRDVAALQVKNLHVYGLTISQDRILGTGAPHRRPSCVKCVRGLAEAHKKGTLIIMDLVHLTHHTYITVDK